MTAILVKALADLRRRRVQAAVIFLTVLLAMATGTMALTLMSQTRDPYQAAFEAQKGAHLQVEFKASTDPQLLASTPAIIGASAAGGHTLPPRCSSSTEANRSTCKPSGGTVPEATSRC